MGLSSKCTTLKTVQSALNTQPDLSVYESDLEISLLKRTSDYYARKSRVWLEDQTTPEYLTRAEMALKAERNRVKRYLHPSTQSKLLSACEQELLQKYKGPLINHDQSGLRSLLAEDRNEDLRRMFNLFRRLADGLSPMALMTKKFVKSEGGKLLQERRDLIHSLKSKGRKLSSNDPDLIDQLMTLHSKMSRLVLELFDNEAQFQRALREAFQEVMNADTTSDDSNVELLVVHTDRILSGKLKLDEEEVENRLEHCIQLFQFVSDKDLYAELYRERLAKRLLSKKYTSIHAEKSMIVNMKTQQGAPFTTKLEGMVNDFTVGSYQLSLFNSFSFLS